MKESFKISLAGVLIAAGCEAAQATSAPQSEPTTVPTERVTPTFTLEPTKAPIPKATQTETPPPRPTETPIPTPTPDASKEPLYQISLETLQIEHITELELDSDEYPRFTELPPLPSEDIPVEIEEQAGASVVFVGEGEDGSGRATITQISEFNSSYAGFGAESRIVDSEVIMPIFRVGIIFDGWMEIPGEDGTDVYLIGHLPGEEDTPFLARTFPEFDAELNLVTAVSVFDRSSTSSTPDGEKTALAGAFAEVPGYEDIPVFGWEELNKLIRPGDVLYLTMFFDQESGRGNLLDENGVPYIGIVTLGRFGGAEQVQKELQ